MNSILVTGASGFLGAAVAARLEMAKTPTIGLDPRPSGAAGRRHIIDDLSNRQRLVEILRQEGITHVIHCGGVSGPMVLRDDPAQVMDINVGGSLNLIHASLKAGVQTFIYCSSVSAIGSFYQDLPIDDDYPLRPTTPYGCSKAAMDMVLRGLWRRVLLDLCSLRFTSIYGPGRQTQSVVGDIVTAALRGEAAAVEPTTGWPYIYIDDAADAAIAACFSARRRQLFYFVSYPEQVTLEDLAAAAGRIAGSTVELAIDERQRPAPRGPLDIGPAQRDFDFAPKIDHREGIRQMIEARRAIQL